MKKIIFMVLLLVGITDIVSAYNAPKGMADVLRRSMNSSGGWWLAKFGHVAIYNSDSGKVLAVSDKYPAIHGDTVESMMKNGYKGARYGKANYSQGAKALTAGYVQQGYRPQYTYSPYYTEGKWGYSWKWSWSKFRWYKSWHKKRAHFRCDSFINYCYKKGIGRRLVKNQWTTTPYRVHKKLPRRR